MPQPAPQSSSQRQVIVVKKLAAGTTVVNLLGTGSVSKPPGAKGKSWIAYYQSYVQQVAQGPQQLAPLTCCVEGCWRTDVSGGHVKIASNPAAAALLHTRWYVVPACAAHNKRSSCKTFSVKPVYAVEAPPALNDRIGSWGADLRKAVRTIMGKR